MMLPETLDLVVDNNLEDFEIAPSLTYRIDFENNRIIGRVDEKEAVFQFIRKVLSIDKYSYASYDWYYGNEILTLVGQSYDYIVLELPRIISEALLVDDRITYIDEWKFNNGGISGMNISFVVHTIYGDLNYSQEVPL